METDTYLLAIDQGTTSTRAILFDANGQPVASAAEPLQQIFPQPGWVEHDADEIWRAVLTVGRKVAVAAGDKTIAALGITNQRETTIAWDRATGAPLHNAIVWQDRRTADFCSQLRSEGLEAEIAQKTGLLIDPYFSATKIAWLLDHEPDLRTRAAAGEVCFGTVDSWLIYKMTNGGRHLTDATNASRTMLFDIRTGRWDPALLQRFAIPQESLPGVRDCQADFGEAAPEHFGRAIPILGVAGDQQAASFGQACFDPGSIKATYGTGCFVLVNTGSEKVVSKNRMLGTIAYQLNGQRTYALEGSIFMAGATIQWLRDTLGLFKNAAETEALARQADERSGVHLVPAFQGLGAPYWDADARGALLGLSRASSKAEIVRAGLESVAFQTRDLLEAITRDMKTAGLAAPQTLRVDGGMTANDWLMQFLANIAGLPVEVAAIAETTALGAAFHAGRKAGIFSSEADLARLWKASRTFAPAMPESEREGRYGAWTEAVQRVRSDGVGV